MIRTTLLAASFAAVLATAAFASDLTLGTVLGTTPEAVSAALTEAGYTVQKHEREHGRIEVKATREGKRYEIKVDATSGAVTAIELDD
ncbi:MULTISPECIES: PepSY domain-containing protein [Thalassobaculum]|uniref:Peptidase propeptide and YPEB domain-containing protein n=1 Tax=Thalassobaculum litoreum DSM 18839 TaxID=1123362 RepID=A0A8G2BLN7_9PROT|nr:MULTISPECIES: PepSY domain-containing protein [Thalassobaculum]SDG42979.1 Peptidase propeptide and YPEB domain-containing protein [Thalassobaculum litoreum DSM 18839]